jgi:hypothetical protein
MDSSFGREIPSGAEARILLVAFAARLKSCPDAYGGFDKIFSAACEVVPFQDIDGRKGL